MYSNRGNPSNDFFHQYLLRKWLMIDDSRRGFCNFMKHIDIFADLVENVCVKNG